MHLLAATPGAIDDGKEPVDLGQSPADVVFISAADTELAALSEARAEMDDAPTLRLANLTHLMHPMSVDLHLAGCAKKSRLIIARILGGSGYWKYGFEQYAAHLHEAGVPFVALPGDDKPDEELRRLSTVSDEDYHALWAYLVEGGADNARAFLAYARAMLEGGERPAPVAPLLRAGVYWPGAGVAGLATARENWTEGAPIVPIVFYRALVQGAGLNPINRLTRALLRRGLNPLPVFVASLKDPVSAATLESLFAEAPPDVILNATAFATGSFGTGARGAGASNPLAAPGAQSAPVFQVVLSASTEEAWESGLSGLSARDIAMNVALPEVDGRILSRAISFKGEAFFDEATQCPIATYRARGDRVDFVADLAAAWARLRRTPPAEKRIALVLANYPNKDGRLANGVGLDTPAATVHVLKMLRSEGFMLRGIPETSDALMQAILAGPTNWLTGRARREGGVDLPMSEYQISYGQLPHDLRAAIEERWGQPEADPFYEPGETDCGRFKLSVLHFGNVVVGIQPARGYNIDPTDTYHSPDLVPPHGYLAFYFWLRHIHRAQAIVHMGKHGNLEWLPGKALALSASCWPEAVLGPLPHIYPFIVNDPGEGTQGKRRTQAVIIDHLTPPLTRAESYGPMRNLEALVDEYYEAAGVDPRRLDHLRREILSLTSVTGLDADAGLSGEDEDSDLVKLDAYLCELKEAQIRDGLHVFGQSPEGRQARDLLLALLRIPRGDGQGANASLLRALAEDFGLGFDPLDCDMAARWDGPKPEALAAITDARWRSAGDTVERLEMFAAQLLETEGGARPPGGREAPARGGRSGAARDASAPGDAETEQSDRPEGMGPPAGDREEADRSARAPGDAENRAVSINPPGTPRGPGMRPPAPQAGASAPPSGGRMPSVGSLAASGSSPGPATAAVLAYAREHLAPAVAACGPAELAGLLTALAGRFVPPGPSGAPTRGRPDTLPTGRNFYSVDARAVPTPTAWALGWKSASLLIDKHLQTHGDWPGAMLITAWGTANMRTGGDDIAQALALMGVKPQWDAANRRVTGFEIIPATALGRPRVDVTLRISGFFRDAFPQLIALFDSAAHAVMALDEPADINPAAHAPGDRHRIFGSKPGAYGAGLQAMIDERLWADKADLAEAYLEWGGYAYGAGGEGQRARAAFETRLRQVDAIVQNQDNREHDLLDSDDYYQFEGGAAAAVATLQGQERPIYHNDHSRPERPVIRTLEDEIGRVVRSRVTNPKWIEGVRRHGYKGAFEIAATVDYMFAFAATTGAVKSHHFDMVHTAFLEDEDTRTFIEQHNAPALREIAQRLAEAIERGLWVPKSNSARALLGRLK